MAFIVENCNSSLRFCLTVLKFFGFLVPHEPTGNNKKYFVCYWFSWFMFIVGYINIPQICDIIVIWGDISLMTSAAFLLFTNLALTIKIINLVTRRRQIQAIIDETEEDLTLEYREEGIQIVKKCNLGTTFWFLFYALPAAVTVFGLAASAEKNQLPLRAWYPYDTSQSPAYEVTYCFQSAAIILSAMMNVNLDTLVTSVIAVCRCRLRLVRLSLRNLCEGIPINEMFQTAPEYEKMLCVRLRNVALKHQSALKAAAGIQTCFTVHLLAQLTVSTLIICVTAFQLAMELSDNWVRLIAMIAYLYCMTLQLFMYCYQGNQLTEQSSEISGAVYECPWYACSLPVRRSLLIVMVRSRRVATLTAGGFTTLSLQCFMSIMKASYTFFTVLQQV